MSGLFWKIDESIFFSENQTTNPLFFQI